jgi:tetratricopeptide (TPR) repeat protein
MADPSQPRRQQGVTPFRRGARPSPQRPAFVGRGAELEQLRRMLLCAEGGEGQMAVIQGPAGIGKTRLSEEVAALSRQNGGQVGIGSCWPDGEAPPLWPWRGILRELGAPEALLEERPEAHGRFARFLAVLDFLRSECRRGACVIVVDDAHTADPASLLLGRFLVQARGLRLLLLLTCRDPASAPSAEVRELLSAMSREAVTIPLQGLPEDAVAELLAAAGGPSCDPELLRAVAAVTQGNPLHLRSIANQGELGQGRLEGGFERAIGDRLQGLGAEDRRIAALAAVMGAEVSVHEVARVADIAPSLAAESLARAVHLGLAREGPGGRFGFVHDRVRQVAMAVLPLSERLSAHARAAALLTSREPAQMARRAHHALSAATRSREDALTAVRIAREAARALRAGDGFEPAAALLGRAAEIHAEAGLVSPLAALAVEQAECVLACGRLAAARPLFQNAERLAEQEGDAVSRARAALGLGGVWVSEQRLAADAERMLALQRRALDALPETEEVLRARLRARLSAEETYRGGPLGPVLAAVEAVRRTGDAHALAEALSLAHHAHLTPEHSARRLPMAAEMIAVAAAAGDGLLSLIGSCWHAVDLFLLGDPAAASALEALRLRADALGCRSVLFIVRGMEVMLAIRAGEFQAAESAAAACFALGTEVGDADALAYHGAHLSAIRYFQGREAELADLAASIAASPTLTERENTFDAAAALFALRAGRPEPARALLQRLAREGIGSITPSSGWLTSMLAVVDIAHAQGDGRIAQAAYDALVPHADLPLMASLAIVCFGSTHRALGTAALTSGKLELAIEHFAAALATNQQLGHRPAAIQSQAELSLARLRRSPKGKDRRGRALLQQAMAEGEAAGMGGLVARWREAAAVLEAGAPQDEPGAALLTQERGGSWRAVLGEHVATLPDRVGLRYLARLLAAPDRAIPALALVVDGAVMPDERGGEPVLDRKALAAIRDRIGQIRERADPSPSESEELLTLTRELGRAAGLGGRVRSFADAPERARTAVRKAIKRAIDEISVASPALGEHLARRIETGSTCRYRLESFQSPLY